MTPIMQKTLKIDNEEFSYSTHEEKYLKGALAYTSKILSSDPILRADDQFCTALKRAPVLFLRGLRAFASVPQYLDQLDEDAFGAEFSRFMEHLETAFASVNTTQWALDALDQQFAGVPSAYRTQSALAGSRGLGFVVLGPFMCEGISPIDLATTEQVFWIRMPSNAAGLFRGQVGLALKAFAHHPYTGCSEGLVRILSHVLGTELFDLFVRVTPLDAYNMLDQGAPYSVLAHAGYAMSRVDSTPVHEVFEFMSAHAARNPFVLPDPDETDAPEDADLDEDDESEEPEDDDEDEEDR